MKISFALRRILRFGLLSISMLCGATTSAQAAFVEVTASQASVNLGGVFSVHFGISGLTAASGSSLSGFDLNVQFDASVLQLSGYSFVDPASALDQLDLPEMGSPGAIGSVLASGGLIDVFDLSGNSEAVLDGLQADSFRFLSLTFTALAASSGSSILIDLVDPDLLFIDSSGGTLPVSFRSSSASITVEQGSAVLPEPAALGLVLVALLAGAWAIRRHPAAPARRAGTRRVALSLALAGALGTALVGTDSRAQTGAVTGAATGAPLRAAANVGTPFDAVVLEVAGGRLKVRTSDGRELWVAVPGVQTADRVGMRVQGLARPRGDTVFVANAVFASNP